MTMAVGKFEVISPASKEKFDWREKFLPVIESISNIVGEDELRRERWIAGNRETALNIMAPALAALGHEPSKRRIGRMEQHGVVGIAEKLAKNYRIDDFKFGANMQELTRSVVSKPGRKVGINNVSLRNLASKHAGLITGELLATHPNTLRKQIEKGDVDPRKGVVVEVAHEIARLSVIHKRMSSSGGDLYREFRKVEKRIRKLVDIGQAAINGDFSEEVMKGGLPALEAAVKSATNKRTRTLASLGLVVGSTVLAACGGNNTEPQKATQVVGGGDQPITVETPIVAMSPTVESTPVSIVIPVPTSTSPVIEIAVGEPIPNIDFEAVPAYVPEASNPVNDVLIPNQVDALRDHGLSVLHSAGFVAYQDANGVEYFPALDEITAASGDAALKKGEMDKNGVLTYKSEDGKTIEHHLLSFDCPDNELCYEVLSFNEEDPGILYLVRVDKETGEVVAHVNTGVAGEAVANGKDIPWQTGESEYWQSSVTGEAALQRGDVKAKSYENGVLTFLDDAGKEHSVDDDDISFYPGFGTVVTDNDGWYTWEDVSDSWVLMSQADAYGGTQLVNGEVIYNVDGKYAIADDNNYYWVEGVEEGDKLTVVTQDGKRWGWDEAQGWVESIVKFSLEHIEGMTSSEMLDAAPTIDGYNPLRVAERYVFYESADGVRDLAYDMSTGEEVEIPQYKICSNEKFYDCEIPKEDLTNGKYWLWLNTLDVKFDPSKIKDVPFVIDTNMYASGWIERTTIYQDSGPDQMPDFSDPTTAPFARNVTSGIVYHKDNGVDSFTAVRPVFFYDKSTGRVYPVIAVESYYDSYEGRDKHPKDSKYQRNYNNWLNNYDVTPLAVGCYTYNGARSCAYSINTGIEDPILLSSQLMYPDMELMLREFATGNYSVLSKPGLVVQTTSDVFPNDNMYK